MLCTEQQKRRREIDMSTDVRAMNKTCVDEEDRHRTKWRGILPFFYSSSRYYPKISISFPLVIADLSAVRRISCQGDPHIDHRSSQRRAVWACHWVHAAELKD